MMLFQLRAHNPITNSSNPSTSTQQQLPTNIKNSSSSESLFNNNNTNSSSRGSSSSSSSSTSSSSSSHNQSILNSLVDNMLPNFLNSQPAPATIQTIPALVKTKDDTLSDLPEPLLISTLNLPPSTSSCSSTTTSSSSSSSALLNQSPATITTSTASPLSIWSTPITTTHLHEFDGPFRLFHHQQQPPQQPPHPFIHTHQPSSSSSSSTSPSPASNLIPPLVQPQPRAQSGQMLLDPSTEFLLANQSTTNDLLPSSPSPSALISNQPHFHHPLNHHHPSYHHHHHPYNPHHSISSPIDHPSSFLQTVQLPTYPHPHHHLHQSHSHHPWHPTIDPSHQTTFYDPFQIKHRRRTTPAQLGILEAQFQSNCKPDVALRKQLADRLDMTPREVQVWFQNRRAKTKKLEKRAEQESSKSTESEPNGNLSRSEASPPASIYLSPPSMRALALPAGINESPDQLPIGISHPSLTSTPHTNGEAEEVDEGLQYRLDTNTDRRLRSHSLHHHPYYLPSSNIFPGQVGNPLTPSASANGTLVHQQFNDPSSDDQSIICRRSSNTSIVSSSATATDSNLICTPTTTEFGTEDSSGLPEGFDPRRRSSCPAEFIQSFGHFGLANGQLTDVTNAQIGYDSSFTPTTSQNADLLPPKLSLAPNPSAPFTILEDQNGGWDTQADYWKTETTREGIQRRHSLATIGSPLGMQEFQPNPPIPPEPINPSQNGLSSLFSWGPPGYPAKHLSSFEAHPSPASNVSNGCMPQGYGRRASTSVLKSIEEHPGNMWN